MVHNGIEYSLMQAYAEGFAILRHKSEFALDLHQVAQIWRYGSVVRSWLLDVTSAALCRCWHACAREMLLVALVAIQVTILVLAVDSIPAVLAVTRDPFLVSTSNVFALLGLRSLYFPLAGVMQGGRRTVAG